MAEMILGYPLFRGRDNNDQLTQIMRIVGTPDDRTLRKINADSVCTHWLEPPRSLLNALTFAAGDRSAALPEVPQAAVPNPHPSCFASR